MTRVPVALAALTVLLQIAYPLTPDDRLAGLTVVTVVAFFLASVVHAAVHRGPGWAAAYTAITVGTGLVAEAVGTATGLPFGDYFYADSLGWKLLGVPVVVPLAWAMMAYPCLLAAQRLAARPVTAALVGAWLLASWDLFLDPQMVEAGHWTWADPVPALPGSPGVPISNYLGWLLVAALMMAALQALPRRTADDRVPTALLLWTYSSSVLAAAVFFGRPAVALLGGLAMGAVVVPWALRLRRAEVRR